MAVETIAVIGTGDMGSAVGASLARSGYRIVTALRGRSAASRELAARAGLDDLDSLDAVVREADLILSIVPPAAALSFARDVAAALASTGSAARFADCNAVAPGTVQTIAELFPAERFIDAGIVGRAPRAGGEPTRFYVSGVARGAVLALASDEIRTIDMGPEIGRASALKMAYASLNKGTDALQTAALLVAERLGIRNELMTEFGWSQAEAARRMAARVPFLAATAARFAGEMAEIATTYEAAGVTPLFHRGAQWIFEQLASTELAHETRATQPSERSLDEALGVFSEALARS